jgi:demethylmenaquinone methyltransferase/2-methoxy-6-polyprenyl-1,4-benzoquinol methylase
MFDRIARRYDLVNTVLSAGADAGWRLRAARATELKAGGSALDVACGSGKLTEQLARIAGPDGRVIGLDFSTQMLEVARHGHPGMKFWEGDALNLPFDDASFDASTIAFGLRNLADPVRGLREMLRVVKRGGRAVVLEFVRPPKGLIGTAYRVYLKTLLPAIGGVLSGQLSAYSYLSQSIDSYRSADELRALAEVAGWKGVRYVRMAMGTVGLLSGGSVDR